MLTSFTNWICMEQGAIAYIGSYVAQPLRTPQLANVNLLSIVSGANLTIDLLLLVFSISVLVVSILLFLAARSREKRVKGSKMENKMEQDTSLEYVVNEKEAQLQKIKKYYESITEMLAHDLKNPLNIILHQLDHMENNKTKQTIENAGNLMMNMLQNVLDVQKFSGSQLPLNKERVNVAELLKGVLSGAELMAQKKNIILQYHSEFTYWAQCDKSILHRLLTNLLINGIKYAQNNASIHIYSKEMDGKLRIAVATQMDEESKQNVQAYLTTQDYEITESKSSSYLRVLFFKLAIESHGELYGLTEKDATTTELWFTLPLVKQEEVIARFRIHSKFETIHLHNDHKQILEPYIEKIRQHSIYELSKIKAFINEMPDLDKEVEAWKHALHESLSSMNEQRFTHLLDSVTKSIEQHEK